MPILRVCSEKVLRPPSCDPGVLADQDGPAVPIRFRRDRADPAQPDGVAPIERIPCVIF